MRRHIYDPPFQSFSPVHTPWTLWLVSIPKIRETRQGFRGYLEEVLKPLEMLHFLFAFQ